MHNVISYKPITIIIAYFLTIFLFYIFILISQKVGTVLAVLVCGVNYHVFIYSLKNLCKGETR